MNDWRALMQKPKTRKPSSKSSKLPRERSFEDIEDTFWDSRNSREASSHRQIVEPAQQPLRDNPSKLVGQVVLLESIAGNRTLATIIGAVKDHPATTPGVWLSVAAADGCTRWIRTSLVSDWHPSCPSCGQRSWWWQTSAALVCATCQPPVMPHWAEYFERLADYTGGLLADDPRFPKVMEALAACDRFYLEHDLPRFQSALIQVQWAMDADEVGTHDV